MHLIKNAFEYLEHSSATFPTKIAFADETTAFTFKELYDHSCSVGTLLAQNNLKGPRIVAIIVNRTALSILGFMSALASGQTYVPIDSKMPTTRIEEILTQIQPSAILFEKKDEKLVLPFSRYAKVICLEEALDTIASPSLLTMRRASVLDIDPAYIIFTSGSTGCPKGILISHRALIDFTEWMQDACDISSSDTLGNQAPFYFDLSVKDIYQTLRNGCTTYILPKKLFLFPITLVEYLNSHNITTLIWATSAFRLLADSGIFKKLVPTSVKKIILGGEALQARHVNIWKQAVPHIKITNLYGPTEVTVDCTIYNVNRDFLDGEPIPIGHACQNKEIILLNDNLQPVAQGEPGEICVRGIGLALGYFGDSEKTALSFIQNPLNPNYPDRLYRTGDIAKYNDNGELIFLARRDEQIKHMGHRIELGEIETALLAINEVQAGICFFDAPNDLIVCYVQFSSENTSISFITNKLKQLVPQYMLPNVWKTVTNMPLNPNGKIDRKFLKEQYFKH